MRQFSVSFGASTNCVAHARFSNTRMDNDISVRLPLIPLAMRCCEGGCWRKWSRCRCCCGCCYRCGCWRCGYCCSTRCWRRRCCCCCCCVCGCWRMPLLLLLLVSLHVLRMLLLARRLLLPPATAGACLPAHSSSLTHTSPYTSHPTHTSSAFSRPPSVAPHRQGST